MEPADRSRAEPIDAVAEIVRSYGVAGRPLRQVVGHLTEGPHPVEALVQLAALPRATVESLLAALGEDAVADHDGYAVRPGRVPAYRERFGYRDAPDTTPLDLPNHLPADRRDLLHTMQRLVGGGPGPIQGLDHVGATAETVVRRALWLARTYDLGGAKVLFVGDHDLTSLALALVDEHVTIMVVDLDDRLLGYVDQVSRDRDLTIRCLFADVRAGLPGAAIGWADVVFTDPPYTPEGTRLFLGRGVEGLRDPEHGRLVMAYGFSSRHPSLGLQVQQGIQRLGIVFEAILPAFNRYHGAQAVGSASDLYVCRPTSRTAKLLASAFPDRSNIYTHGTQSVEAQRGLTESASAMLHSVASGGAVASCGGALPVTAHITAGAGGPPPTGGAQVVRLETLLRSGLPAQVSRHGPFGVTVDISSDQGFWLLRTLLATNATRVAILIPNNHPDVQSGSGQSALAQLVCHKYRLAFLRSTPDSQHAIVDARSGDDPSDPPSMLVSYVLRRAHGRLANVWREGLITAGRRLLGVPVTKNEARELMGGSLRSGLADASLVELPRHQIAELRLDLEESARRLTSRAGSHRGAE